MMGKGRREIIILEYYKLERYKQQEEIKEIEIKTEGMLSAIEKGS